jgi:hypothetical protein
VRRLSEKLGRKVDEEQLDEMMTKMDRCSQTRHAQHTCLSVVPLVSGHLFSDIESKNAPVTARGPSIFQSSRRIFRLANHRSNRRLRLGRRARRLRRLTGPRKWRRRRRWRSRSRRWRWRRRVALGSGLVRGRRGAAGVGRGPARTSILTDDSACMRPAWFSSGWWRTWHAGRGKSVFTQKGTP